jgi:hypothetical protein
VIVAVAALTVPVTTASTATRSAKTLLADWRSTSSVDVVQEGSSRIGYRRHWKKVHHADYLGGGAKATRDAGAKAILKFKGSAVAWVGPIGPTRGRAKVYVDGSLVTTVNTWHSSFVPTRVLFKREWKAVGTHRIKIVGAGTSGHPSVALDAFAVRLDLPTPAPAPYCTLTVPASNTLGSAIANAPDGATVCLRGGTHTVASVIYTDKSLSIVAYPGEVPVITHPTNRPDFLYFTVALSSCVASRSWRSPGAVLRRRHGIGAVRGRGRPRRHL